jgi:hypothetical protein
MSPRHCHHLSSYQQIGINCMLHVAVVAVSVNQPLYVTRGVVQVSVSQLLSMSAVLVSVNVDQPLFTACVIMKANVNQPLCINLVLSCL